MASPDIETFEMEENLIDLNVTSPQLPRCTKFCAVSSEDSDNLMDTELPVLEHKLQKTSSELSSGSPPGETVNVEDILISLEGCDSFCEDKRELGDVLNAAAGEEASPSPTSPISCEALNILSKLDEILNESLRSSEELLQQDNDEDFHEGEENTKPKEFIYSRSSSISDNTTNNTKTEFDGTLGTYSTDEVRTCSDNETEIDDEKRSRTADDVSLSLSYEDVETLSLKTESNSEETSETMATGESCNDDLTTAETHKEGNVDHKEGSGDSPKSKSETVPADNTNGHQPVLLECDTRPVVGGVSGGDNGGRSLHSNLKRAVSNSGGDRGGNFKRNNRWRATMGSTNDVKPIIHNGNRELHPTPTCDRISVPGVESDEEIDWSWVHDVEIERRVHATGDYGTGSVIVEPVQREAPPPEADITDHGRNEDERREIVTEENNCNEETRQQLEGGWQRSSMRRIQHLRLPSDLTLTRINIPDPPEVASAPPPEPEQFQLNNLQNIQGPIENTPTTRPVSAPSRLGTHSSVATQSSVRETRSRSRDSRTRSNVTETVYRNRARSSSASSRSRRLRSLSSSESSLASSIESAPSAETQQGQGVGVRRPCERPRYSDMPVRNSPIGHWPHSMSSMLACLGCTIGLFNISRFAILSVQFGANFILQFFILSILIGLPLFTLQLCLGQQLGAGVIDMWRISPLFQGVGIALLVSQALVGLYSIVGISWMFVFFRDSFITKTDRYRWAEPFIYYRDDIKQPINGTFKLSETVPDYFSGVVLQRHHLAAGNAYCTIKFQLAFNLAVVWMIVFVSLSKGLRSYGKVIYVFVLLPVFGMFVVCAKMLGIMPFDLIYSIFPETTWNEFFINSKSWIAASQEVFLTWGLLGASAMQIASHNKNKHLLQRDSSLIAMITFTILLLSAFLANTCVQLLHSFGYRYLPDSFEKINSYGFLRSTKDPLPANLASTPVRYMFHQSFIVGERVTRPGTDHTSESGYQALRFATELLPTTFAIIGPNQLSPFWAVLFYFTMIFFGITQQLAIWHCVITGIMAIKTKILRSWETTITFFSCACGFVLGLPMATELGIYVIYFLDFTVGGQWWMMLIILIQILAVFMVRGRPYSGDALVNALFTNPSRPCVLSWAPALLSFTWNVILPVALMVWCIIFFKNGNFRELFVWHHVPSLEYWPLWARQLGSMIQLLHVLCVPLVAVIQSYRYLNKGPDDILDRVQLLYRPPIGEHMETFTVHENPNVTSTNAVPPNQISTTIAEDPPPKYTPPPSYTTATGARIAKFLRQSIRRSVRRIANVMGESSRSANRQTEPNTTTLPPPDYNAVLDEINNSRTSTTISVNVIDLPENENQRNGTMRSERSSGTTGGVNLQPGVALSAADVACILRNSFRRSARRAMNIFRRDPSETRESISAENLVESAAPIGQTSVNLESFSNDGHEVKPAFQNPSSVI